MTAAQKDTIYIDVDDEITAIIEKVRGSKHKIIALVLPKRAAVLQSIVNMKLLKRAVQEEKKNLVLITSEAHILPLAGALKLHVAKTLQTKPYIPLPPEPPDTGETVVNETAEPEVDKNAPVGELAGTPAPTEDETIEVDNETDETDSKKPDKSKKTKAEKPNKRLKIPNFDKFRTRLFLGITGLVLLIVGWLFAFVLLPKAHLTVVTDTTGVESTLSITVNSGAKELDKDNKVLPATLRELKKVDTEKVAASGQKDVGQKATGTISLKNCEKVDGKINIPAGTVMSTNNLGFASQTAVDLPASTFSGGGTCTTATVDVGVTAQNGGTQYNLAEGLSYTVSGRPNVRGTGSAMTGGTSQVIKVVSQQDVDSAKQTLNGRGVAPATDELSLALKTDGLIPIAETLTNTEPAFDEKPKVGDEGAEVTVTSTATYTMLGVKEDVFKTLLDADVAGKIDTSKQQIQDYGIASAVFRQQEKKSPNEIKLSMQTVVTAGPQLNADELKGLVAGKKRGEAERLIKERPGIKEVTVDYSPFWVLSTPKRTSRINVVFQNANGAPN